MAWDRGQIIKEIYRIAPMYDADPALMVAVAKTESGLRPNAVGDQGSSFGLFQNHVGGAGGSTLGSARRFLDPRLSIQSAAQRFAGARTAADAFGVQRPADRASYIAKIQGNMGGGGRYTLNSPVSGLGGSTPIADPLISKHSALANIHAAMGEAPQAQYEIMNSMIPQAPTLNAGNLSSQAINYGPVGQYGPIGPVKGAGYQLLDAIANKFGLEHDPGVGQTTGGEHHAGSQHYLGLATDYGSARNSVSSLNAYYNYLNANRNKIGITELLRENWGGPNAHVHAAVGGR